MKTVYLAGPIFATQDPAAWRTTATRVLSTNWNVINPLTLEVNINKPYQLVAADLSAISNCRAVLAKVDCPSWGTAMEIFYATNNNIPVIGWRPGSDGPDSPWLRRHTKVIYRSLSQALSSVKALYNE